jgi:predicted membrane-bound spermidine synthase
MTARAADNFPVSVSYTVFFLSGMAAILYQILWQRAVFTMFGSNSESVTIVVSAFMLGLGVGSIAGGALSKRFPEHLIPVFAGIEAAIGLFGLVSLRFFEMLREVVLHTSDLTLHIVSFLGVALPVSLMGMTLPVLVAYLVRQTSNVGHSVGVLYYVNTLGSAAGSFLGALFLFRVFGMSDSVSIAASLNLGAAVTVFAVHRATSARSS